MEHPPWIELLHAAEVEAYTKEVANYEAALAQGIPAHFLAKPEKPEPLILRAHRISQMNKFHIGYTPYWYGKRGKW